MDCSRQQNQKSSAAAGRALHVDHAAMCFDDSLNRRQTQSAARKLRSEKWIEDARLRRLIHAGTCIADLDFDVLTWRVYLSVDFRSFVPAYFAQTSANRNFAGQILADGLSRVNHQIHHHLLDLRG